MLSFGCYGWREIGEFFMALKPHLDFILLGALIDVIDFVDSFVISLYVGCLFSMHPYRVV